MKDKITKAEALELQTKQGFTLETLRDMFDISRTRKQTFTVEHERQYAIKFKSTRKRKSFIKSNKT
jgi:hypothetical protein